MDNYSLHMKAVNDLEKYTKTLTKRFKDKAYNCSYATGEHQSQFNYYLNGLMRAVKRLRYADPIIKKQFEEFVVDKIIYDPESNDHLKISHIYIEYKEWYKDNYGSSECRSLRELKAYFEKKYTYHFPDGFKGLSFINADQYLIDSNIDFIEDE